MPTFGSLFSGIGGLDLGLERAGWTCRWQVEIDPFCQRVLARHWPDVARYGDIRTLDLERLERVDLLCGGFPCQPVSRAGKRLAQDDERWLWPEFSRIIRALRPPLILVENTPGLLDRGLGDVLGDLAASGYDAEWECIPAAAVGAPHLRDRVWIVAYARRGSLWADSEYREERGEENERKSERTERQRIRDSVGGEGENVADAEGIAERSRLCPDESGRQRGRRSGDGGGEAGRASAQESADTERQRLERLVFTRPAPGPADGSSDGRYSSWWAVEPNVGRVAHGVPARMDRLRGLGNAVVPQVAEWIGRRLIEVLR